MLRFLNRLSGFFLGIILYPLKSLLVNLFLASLILLVSLVVIIGLPALIGAVVFEKAITNKAGAALLAGVLTSIAMQLVVPPIVVFVLITLTVSSVQDVYSSILLGAREGYREGLFFHVIKQALTKVAIFSRTLNTSNSMFQALRAHAEPRNGLGEDGINALTDIEDMDYTQLVDVEVPRAPQEIPPELQGVADRSPSIFQPLTAEELDLARGIPELRDDLERYNDLHGRLAKLNAAIEKRATEAPKIIERVKSNLNEIIGFAKSANDKSLAKNAEQLIAAFQDNQNKTLESKQIIDTEQQNFEIVVDLLTNKNLDKDTIGKHIDKLNLIRPDNFEHFVKHCRGDELPDDLVCDEITKLPIEKPSLLIKLYESEPNKWKPVPGTTKIIDFANLKGWLSLHNSHPETREPMNDAIRHKGCKTIYRIFPYNNLGSSHALTELTIQIRKRLAPPTLEDIPSAVPSLLTGIKEKITHTIFGSPTAANPTASVHSNQNQTPAQVGNATNNHTFWSSASDEEIIDSVFFNRPNNVSSFQPQ